jgi:hypothetical protein
VLPASNNTNTRSSHKHYIVVALWLLLTGLAAVYFINSRLAAFDPNMKLTGKNANEIVNQLKKIDELNYEHGNKKIIHITSDNCSCTQFSKTHKDAINKTAKEDGFSVNNVNLPANFSSIIPATPSILILNENNELLYFGPYSAGLACTESNGYIETVLNNYSMGYNSNLIVNDVEGCYCSLP